jgi:hypothetical protein
MAEKKKDEPTAFGFNLVGYLVFRFGVACNCVDEDGDFSGCQALPRPGG